MTNFSASRANVGILACGAYLPNMRLARTAIANAIGWAAPAARAMAKGHRAVANWDEDAVTMAVEASRQCLAGSDRSAVRQVILASTTAPFADRSNSGIAVDALRLPESTLTTDAGGSRRAATSQLEQALSQGGAGQTLIMATDCREAQPGSTQEMLYGHGAAALLIGAGEPLATLLGHASVHRDLVDQYRGAEGEFDYSLEERWVRDEGYLKIVPEAVSQALQAAGIKPGDVKYFVLPAAAAIAAALVKQMGLNNAQVVDSLQGRVGDCGAAQPLLMLVAALEQAGPNEVILLVGFGQGADALVLRTGAGKSGKSVFSVQLAGGRDSDHYVKYLALRGQLHLDYGIRAERDNRTALSAFYRRRDAITGFMGGRCSACGMLQFPRSAMCVGCAAQDTQKPESFAELTGVVKSYTEDWQAYTPSPPLIYGNVTFPDGGNVMMEFTDLEAGELKVGQQVRMAFRIKDVDERRGFRRYFWKPVALHQGGAHG